jgi:outer membrane protein assembly factor BamB
MNKLIFTIFFYNILVFSQQQVDIPWPTLAKSDWPMIKHDPQFTGRSPYIGPQTPTIVWTADLKDGIFSGPVVGTNGNLYFGSYYQDPNFLGLSDYFYSYGPDGKFLWQYKTGTNRPPQAGIVIDSGNTIYFGSLDQHIYALNPDGSLKWRYKTSAAIPEVAISNIDLQGNIYITNGLGELYSMKPDGTLNWNKKYENGFYGAAPAFSPDGNTIYISGRDSNLFALNLDGTIKWKFTCGRIHKGPMVDNANNLYFISTRAPQYFYSLFPDGSVRWKFWTTNSGGPIYSSPSTMDYEGNLYFIAYDTTLGHPLTLFSVDNGGSFRWRYALGPGDDFWQPLICDSEGTIYIGSTFGYFYYAISSHGQLKWKLPLEFNKKQVDNTGAIIGDGTLYLGVHATSLESGLQKTLIAIRDTATVSIRDLIPASNSYNLSQNYPNPFNPSTTIKYSLAQAGRITLSIYDLLGREVIKLIDEEKPPGEYETIWNTASYPSGVYFLKMQAGQFSETRKLILVK